MSSYFHSNVSGNYLSQVNHTFFDAVTTLDTILNGLYDENEKQNILRRVNMLSHIQNHLYHSDEYSNMSFIELDAAVNNLLTLEEKEKSIQLFGDTFGYHSTNVEEQEAFQKIILRICLYHKSWVDEVITTFRSDFTDDFYEWFIYTRKLDNASLEDRCVGMHDAWALALMYEVHVCEDGKYIFVPKRELGTKPDVPDESLPIINDYNIGQMYDFLSTYGNKEPLRIQFNDLFHCEVRTVRLESRRLNQLVDYSYLSREEKLKDLIPAMVFYYVNRV